MSDTSTEPRELAALAAGVAAVASVAWALPQVIAWLFDGSLAPVPVAHAIVGTADVIREGRWHDPAAAYPPAVRSHMPDGRGWWLGAAMTMTALASSAIAIWRTVDRLGATSRLGRRSYDLRGRRPRSWAHARDVPELVTRRRAHDRFSLGRLEGRWLAAAPEAHVAVIAPTRSGKTTRCVIPWLLEHEGPAIVTSTKTDVVLATRG